MSEETMDGDIIRTCDVAKMFHRSKSSIHAWIRQGVFPEYCAPYRVHAGQRGYFWSRAALQRFIKEQQGGAA